MTRRLHDVQKICPITIGDTILKVEILLSCDVENPFPFLVTEFPVEKILGFESLLCQEQSQNT